MSYCFIWEDMSKTRASCFIMVFKQRELRWKHSPASVSAHRRESKTVWDPEFHTVDYTFRILDSKSLSVELSFGLQSLVGFRIPWVVFGIPQANFPRFRIPRIGFQSLSVELWLWIAIVSGIPDFLSCISGSKVYDSGFHKQISQIPDSGYWIPVFVSGPLILDCNLYWDSGFLELYYGFQSPGFLIIRAKISWIPESGFPYMSRSVSWCLEPVMKHSPSCLM